MKNVFKRCIAFALTAVMAIGLLPVGLMTEAKAAPYEVEPYYVIVTAKDGLGVNLRAGAGVNFEKLRENPIPMQAKLLITKEDTAANGKKWGYTTYENVSGWIGLTEVTKTGETVSSGSSSSTNKADTETILDKIPYLGGKKSDMNLTAAQAEAFADVLKGKSGKTTRAILFNANGSVAMFVMESNYGIRDYQFDGREDSNTYGCSFDIMEPGPEGFGFGFNLYMWDGEAVIEEHGDDTKVYTNGVMHEQWTGSQSELVASRFMPFKNGVLNRNNTKTYGVIEIWKTGMPTLEDIVDYFYGANLPDLSTVKDDYWYTRSEMGSVEDCWQIGYINDEFVPVEKVWEIDNGSIMISMTLYDAVVGGDASFFGAAPITGAAMESALREYADVVVGYTYPKAETVDDAKTVEDVAKAAAEALGGEVTAIYKLEEGVYYVIITVNGVRKGVMIRGIRVNGEIVWKTDETHDKPADQATLDGIVASDAAKPNVELDFNEINGATSDEVVNILADSLDNMPGVTPNDAAKSEIVSFIETAVSSTCAGAVSSKDNRLVLSGNHVSEIVKQAQNMKINTEKVLSDRGVELNKKIVLIVRVLWQDVDMGSACQITLDKTLLESLDGCGIKILLGDSKHYLQMTSEDLKAIVDTYGAVNVQLACKSEGIYTVNFLDVNGNIIEKLDCPVNIALPADSALSTIMVSVSGGSFNWGGQYSDSNGVIMFGASYSGQYEIIENNVAINDIEGCDEETKNAIAFLVSKGYMSADGGIFEPDRNLTRYEFTQALVGMFFALDPTLKTAFTDVPEDSAYYAYVASGEADNIIEGFEDNTFRGDTEITNEQILALAARTLIDYKGYIEPEDFAAYLAAFTDGNSVSDWAKRQVALSVRQGIVDRGGELEPQGSVTRGEAALILYRLFLLLNEVPAVALDLPPVVEAEVEDVPAEVPVVEATAVAKTSLLPIIVLSATAAAAAIAGVLFALSRKKGGAKAEKPAKTAKEKPAKEKPEIYDFSDDIK